MWKEAEQYISLLPFLTRLVTRFFFFFAQKDYVARNVFHLIKP